MTTRWHSRQPAAAVPSEDEAKARTRSRVGISANRKSCDSLRDWAFRSGCQSWIHSSRFLWR